MLVTLMCGVVVGLSLVYVGATAFPKPAAPATVREPEHYAPSHRLAAPAQEQHHGPLVRAVAPMTPWLGRLGLPREARRRDLALVERNAATHLAHQIASALALALLGAGFFALLTGGGLRVPVAYMSACVGIPLLYGFLAPSNNLKNEARAHRDALRQATGSFLTLASMCLAAGGSLGEALATAAQAGQGAAAQQLRGALAYADTAGTPPWDALAELGRRAQVPELTELAAAVSLAGVEGARLRTTLITKSRALRQRQLTAREAAETAAAEKTALPTALMMSGYLVLIAAPAAASALHTL
jgi:tight adherence protein C